MILFSRYKWNNLVRPQTFIVYQSMIIIMEHHALFMWNQYRWNIGVRGLGREHREREQDVADWGEGERTELAREYGVGFYMKDSYFGFDR